MTTVHEPFTSNGDTNDESVCRRAVALQYLLSASEYRRLRAAIFKKGLPIPKWLPSTAQLSGEPTHGDAFRSSFRLSSRILVVGTLTLRSIDAIKVTIAKRRGKSPLITASTKLRGNPSFQFPLSIATIVFLHRTLFRLLSRLRMALLSSSAAEFCQGYPNISRLMTHDLIPSIGASLAGIAIAIGPAESRRTTIAIYCFTKALEFLYNTLEDMGYMAKKPSWCGKWLLFPIFSAQLLHACVFDRDCLPKIYGNTFMRCSTTYIQARPPTYPSHLAWPSREDILDGLAKVAQSKHPSFKSPILFPYTATLPESLVKVGPLVSPAHPGIKQLSCALLHSQEPSCSRNFAKHMVTEFTQIGKTAFIIYAIFSLLQFRKITRDGRGVVLKMLRSVLRTTTFATSVVGISWASVCALQKLLPGGVLPTQRFYLSGFLGGLAAFVDRNNPNDGTFMYAFRTGLETWWKVATKHKYIKPVPGGDIILFVLSLATLNVLFDRSPQAISSTFIKQGLKVLRGEGLHHRAPDDQRELTGEKETSRQEGDVKLD